MSKRLTSVVISSRCKEFLIYGSSGKKQLLKHAVQCEKNESRKLRMQNTRHPLSWLDPPIAAKPFNKCSQPLCSLPYGTPENVYDSSACSTKNLPAEKLIVAVSDCKSNTEVFILSFAVLNLILISTILKLVELGKFLVKAAKTLQGFEMNRTSAF